MGGRWACTSTRFHVFADAQVQVRQDGQRLRPGRIVHVLFVPVSRQATDCSAATTNFVYG
jgi:hypothetical protein